MADLERSRTVQVATRPAPFAALAYSLQETVRALGVLAEFITEHVCPECRQGKHANCNGDGGWDDETDQPVPCVCWESGHQLNT